MESLTVRLASADPVDTHHLAELAARTFSLACPPSVAPADIASFVAANLSDERFAQYAADPDRAVLVATHGDRMVGYAMVVRDDDTAELSKMYVLPGHHGSGVAAALMDRALQVARDWRASGIWLGVNRKNQRAQRFYVKSGFAVTGTRTFAVGGRVEDDYVMSRALG